jgi:hypothetical protein
MPLKVELENIENKIFKKNCFLPSESLRLSLDDADERGR